MRFILADLYKRSTLLAMIPFYKYYIWLLPFSFFTIGYMGMRWYVAPVPMNMPSLIGLNAKQALITLSDYFLIPHIVAQKEENNVPQGTILQQNPTPGCKIKKRQSVFLVISTISTPTIMPDYIHKSYAEIQRHSKQENISLHIQYVPHIWPHNTCFSQWPLAGEPLTSQTPCIYISSGHKQPIIWPNFIGHDAEDVITFLHNHHITPDIISHYTQADISSYKGKYITDQRPLPGSCVYNDNQEQCTVQLRIE